MPTLQGLNINVSIIRREQQPDDSIGGSVQQFIVIRSGIPARITQMGTPPMLRMQGLENTDNYTCVIQPLDPTDFSNIRMDDIVRPETGQYMGMTFVITNISDNPYADTPTDLRSNYRRLSLRFIRDARQLQ